MSHPAPSRNEPGQQVNQQDSVYLPGLNGLRAIAALAVVFSHITRALQDLGLNYAIFGHNAQGKARGLALAGHGVTLFFTLSGFLITYLLLLEKEKSGKINIPHFYIRRALRIWPMYYLYLALCLITFLIYKIQFSGSALPYYLLLAANIPFIAGHPLPFLAHYWSLGVEEQFYLFFPFLARLKVRRLETMAWLFIILLLFFKIIAWILYKWQDSDLPFLLLSVNRFHTMFVGVLGAIYLHQDRERFISLCTHRLAQAIAWICMVLLALNKFHVASVIDGELVSVISLILIIGQVTRRNHLISLENKAGNFIGKISYGIYVVHPLVIFYFGRITGQLPDRPASYFLAYLGITVLVILIAWILNHLIEKRFMQAKTRFMVIRSSDSK